MSAPAARASSHLAGSASTSTFTLRPVPCGRLTVPRTISVPFLGSTPRRTAMSTVASNFVVLTCFTMRVASGRLYVLAVSYFDRASLRFLLGVAMASGSEGFLTGHRDTHAAGRAGHHAHGALQAEAVQVGHL